MDPYIGKLLDNRYEILEVVGTGGMARVYKARCHRLNRLVAIKILHEDLSRDAEFRRRFHDESQAVAMLSHPNIVSVYDVSRSSELEYIVMELIDGISLKQYMSKKGNKLNWREALHFITQITKALGHAHSRGIIHRDIKPHNVMVLRDGSVKVADFGIARLMSGGQSTLTQEALGSVHYISPEQARGSHIDSRSDLYSAGVVLYEMITGRLPFEGDTAVSVAIQHINSIPLTPREIDDTIPEALEAITMKAMAPKPENRYASADEMLADLEEFRKNPNISFDYDVSVFSAEIDCEDDKTRPITGTRVAAGGKKPPERRSRRYEDEDEESARGPIWPILLSVAAILLFVGGVFFFLYQTVFSGFFAPPVEKVKVPNLVGGIYETVQQDLNLLGDFKLILGETVSDDSAAGTILKQSPEGGTELMGEAAREITVTISGGPEPVSMPDLAKKEYLEAYLEVQELGLKPALPTYEYHDEIPENHVISHTPLTGNPVAPGSEVHMVVSRGPQAKMIYVPYLLEISQAEAENKLSLYNLTRGSVIPAYSSSVEAGKVMDQYPAAGDEVEEGSAVNLTVSKGPDPTLAPPEESTETVTLPLPATDGEVYVSVTLDGAIVYEDTVDTAMVGSVTQNLTGSGSKSLQVFCDGTLYHEEIVEFTQE